MEIMVQTGGVMVHPTCSEDCINTPDLDLDGKTSDKSKNKNGSEYDFSGLLTIDDDF